MKFTTIQLHDLVSLVEQHLNFPQEYTCVIVKDVFSENKSGFVWAWTKLLEETFPGSAYQKNYPSSGYPWQNGATTSMWLMNTYSFINQFPYEGSNLSLESPEIRILFIEKLKKQPDRTLVVPVV